MLITIGEARYFLGRIPAIKITHLKTFYSTLVEIQNKKAILVKL